jgi:hypothetical protein
VSYLVHLIEAVSSTTPDKFAYDIKLKTFHHSLVVFVPLAMLIAANHRVLGDLLVPITYITTAVTSSRIW